MIRPEASVGCAVLAAGTSRHRGRLTPLAQYRGQPLLRRAALVACASSATCTAAVLGAQAAEARAVLNDLPLDLVENADWELGMSSSVRTAVEWARGRDCDGLLLAVADQPYLSVAHLDALIAASAGATRIAASAYDDVLGVPAIFPWELFHRLESLSGDQGPRALLRHAAFRVVPVAWSEGDRDIDRLEDLEAVCGRGE